MLGSFTDDWSTGALLFAAVVGVGFWPATVLIHELGHAVVARRHGVPVKEVVATPEGRTIRVTIGGIPIRAGLGLKREWRSEALYGWTTFGDATVSRRAATQIVAAGPVAHGLFSAFLLFLGVRAHLPEPLPLPVAAQGGVGLLTALVSLFPYEDGQSDGAILRRIRRLPVHEPIRDLHEGSSVPPPSGQQRL